MNARFERVARMFDDDSAADPVDDTAPPVAEKSTGGDEPVYAFEGYAVDFNDKVALLPLQPPPMRQTPTRATRAAPA